MFKKIIQNKKGTAMVFTVVLIANALVILSSIVFISAIQNQASGMMSATVSAFQKTDSGMEYILKKINHDLIPHDTHTIDEMCDSFDSTKRVCKIDNIASSSPPINIKAYFLDDNNQVLDSSAIIDDIEWVKVTAEERGIYRSIKTTLFQSGGL